MTRVRIPADVDREDTLLAGLSARQLAILITATVVIYAGYLATRSLVPLPIFAGLATPIGLLGIALALGRRDGVSGDRLAIAALHYVCAPKRLVPTVDDVSAVPACISRSERSLRFPAPLRLPVQTVAADGTMDLGAEGAALICRASSVTFSLRTDTEQEALVAAFGRFLNGITAPLQLVVRSERVDLAATAAEIDDAAGSLPHSALEAAAREHAGFLRSLGERHNALRREVLVVFREQSAADPGRQLSRRAEDATSALAAATVTLTPLGADSVAVLSRCTDPQGAHRPAHQVSSDEIVHGTQR